MKSGDRIPGLVGWEYHGNPADIPAPGRGRGNRRKGGTIPHMDGDGASSPKANFVFNAATIFWVEAEPSPGHTAGRIGTARMAPTSASSASRGSRALTQPAFSHSSGVFGRSTMGGGGQSHPFEGAACRHRSAFGKRLRQRSPPKPAPVSTARSSPPPIRCHQALHPPRYHSASRASARHSDLRRGKTADWQGRQREATQPKCSS